MVPEFSPKSLSLSGLARRLVVDGLLDESTALKASQDAQSQNMAFISYVVQKKILQAKDIALAASQDFGLPLLDLQTFDVDQLASNLVSDKLINKHHAIPLYKRGDRLYIAISDPTNLSALNEFKFHTGVNTHGILVEENKLSLLIDKVLSAQETAALGDLDASLEDISVMKDEELDVTASEADDAPIVRFVHKILLEAINKRVSDIHFEPYEKIYRIRYRLDGILYETAIPPLSLAPRITARLKVMSRLDISERRLPQDGHFKMSLSKNRAVDFRVSTCPTISGEKVVVRILDPTTSNLSIEELGMEKRQRELFLEAIDNPQGMMLVTGPTGSGKTVSLYAALNILNTYERNISTIEDPVEINLQGINQVNINLKAGLDFASALRSFLRQDPDIIMVGEIRDLETAEIAIKAAQTGHLVLSTLHTNSAPETLTRLLNMGVLSFNIATSINLVVAQRLVRCLCKFCRIPEKLPVEALLALGFEEAKVGSLNIFGPNAVGCEHCKMGYSGRIGVYEVMPITEAMGQLIMEGANSLKILALARQEGMLTLKEAGLLKAEQGLTSLEELNRVL